MFRFFQNLGRFYRRFVVVALCFLLCYCFYAEHKRAKALVEIKRFTTANRRMLNARAQIQIILINANIESRKLTNEEIDRIGRLWASAEYDQTAEVDIEK
jgi:hypothetical protein